VPTVILPWAAEACRSLPEKIDIEGIFHTRLSEKSDTGGGVMYPDIWVLRAIVEELEHDPLARTP
jgi:hypothetical protein